MKIAVSFDIYNLEADTVSHSYNEVIISDYQKENPVRIVMNKLSERLIPDNITIRENIYRCDFEGIFTDENGTEKQILHIQNIRDCIIERIEV